MNSVYMLGVERIVPVIMDRTQAPPAGPRVAKKAQHWWGVIRSAAAQSGRTTLPTLDEQIAFRDWLARAGDLGGDILLDPDGDYRPGALALDNTPVHLIAGPEGGCSDAEREQARASGCRGMRLGPRVLRTETAAVAGLSLLQGLYGDMA